MRRKKIWLWSGLLVLGGILGLHGLFTHPTERLAQRYGLADYDRHLSHASEQTVLTQKSLLVSNKNLLPQGWVLATSREKFSPQEPSRENGWVAANTQQSIDDLARSSSAILLRNARIDTRSSAELPIPSQLMAGEDPGCYLVQSRGGIDGNFYRQLEEMGVEVISYIPNNAVLAVMTPEQAAQGSDAFQSVLPYHPYYKLESELLEYALGENEAPYRAGTIVQVALAPGLEESFFEKAREENLTVLSRQESQFGVVVMVQPAQSQIAALAQLPSVHLMGMSQPVSLANDLTMIRLGVATNEANIDSYLELSGNGVLLNVNDSMVDTSHPALSGRVLFATDERGNRVLPSNTNEMAHGTHVMGTILGNGAESESVAGGASGSYEGFELSFKGAATNAEALYLPISSGELSSSSLNMDMIRWAARTNYLERKRTNALISNNSWNFSSSRTYDLVTALFDGAVRDALPDVTGSQPMVFVFGAGNSGSGNHSGSGGVSGSILAPATGKNVITVGALESPRYVSITRTNEVYETVDRGDGVLETVTNLVVTTNATLYNQTDNEQHVANYSSRGNVGVGEEGSNGRRKPDVVAPGSFVVSTRGPGEVEEIPETYFRRQLLSGQFLISGDTNNYAFFGETNLVGLTIEILTNRSSVLPLPDLGIYLRKGTRPGPDYYVGDNFYQTNFLMNVEVEIDPEDPEGGQPGNPSWSSGYGDWYYSIGGSEEGNANFDILLTFELLYSEEQIKDMEDLAASNELLGEYYRYDSGTSMAAAAVTGILALTQEFFETYSPAGVTSPSPALLKALLINGSNPSGNQYSRREPYGVNYQGWGVPNMTNLIPAALTNEMDSGTWPLWFEEQSMSNALSTGEAWEKTIQVPAGMEEGNMKVTLVWTDPAGNPSAAIKLVNDLDLVVSNATRKLIYVGNDFPINGDFNQSHVLKKEDDDDDAGQEDVLRAIETARDFVNNVESVVIKGPLDTNYVLSVQARRVNVNAVRAHPDGIVQDFALVVSFQNHLTEFSSTNRFEVEEPDENSGILGTNLWIPVVDTVTNSVPLLKQRVGAHSPLLGVDDILTNGVAPQWHFYVFTNVWWAGATNQVEPPDGEEPEDNRTRVGGPYVAFATFLPPNLSSEARLNNADIDLYVSTNSAITNLDALVIDEAVQQGWASRKQGGSELFYITNSVENQVFYVGIKSEDQKASEYNFVGISSDQPFDENDNGNRIVRFHPGAVWVPDGSPDEPGGIYLFAIVTDPIVIDNLVITNLYQVQNSGDLYISLTHAGSSLSDETVALHNHSFLTDINDPALSNQVQIVYDDSEQLSTHRQKTDGPGSLRNFMGEDGTGLWFLSLTDNALNHTNRVSSSLYITPYNANAWFTVNPYSFLYRSFYVEDDVIGVNITISEIDPEYPLELYVRGCNCGGSESQCTLESCYPTRTVYDYRESITPPGRTVTITRQDIPPLETGRYWLGVYNPNAVDVDFRLDIEFIYGFSLGDDQGVPSPNTPLELQDDAYTLLKEDFITFVNPEDGSTNVVPVVYDSVIHVADDREVKNVNVGVRIDHPRISDLAFSLVSPVGTSVLLAENRGWGATNAAPDEVDIIPNEDNNSTYGSGSTNDFGKMSYAFFSSDTNYTLLPIKFEVPPYTNNGKGVLIRTSTFEDAEPGIYDESRNLIVSDDLRWLLSGSTNTNVVWEGDFDEDLNPILPGTLVTNLTVVTNFRTWVKSNEVDSFAGTNYLIANRTVLRTEITNLAPSSNYVLRLPFKRSRPLEGILTWWRANNDYLDSEWNLPLEVAEGFSWPEFTTNGMEGSAFAMTNANLIGKAPHILQSASTNFTVEGWLKIDENQVYSYSDRYGGPNMPIFEFTQVTTNYWTNIVQIGEDQVENIYEYYTLNRGMSVWLKGNNWTNGYQRLFPHGTLQVELGPNSINGSPVMSFVNLVTPGANPSTEDYLNTFTNWLHLAITFTTDEAGDTMKVYSNGNLMLKEEWPHGFIIPSTWFDYNMGYGHELAYTINSSMPNYYSGTYTGFMDEFSWYSQPLDEVQIQDIVDAGRRGKGGMAHTPISVQSAAEVTLREVGATTNLFRAPLPDILSKWQVGKGRFQTRALESGETENPVYELIIDVTRGAVAFDDISVTTRGIAYEPEVSLANLRGEDARGDWRLLVWDTRAGATNPTPALLSWTLDLGYTGTNVNVIDLTRENNYTHSGVLSEDQTTYFRVYVPQDAVAATNILSGATNMLLAGRWTGTPRFDRSIDDYLWFYNSPTNESRYIINTNITSVAPLIPGGRYYLALRNQLWTTNNSRYRLQVDFGDVGGDIPEGIITLTNRVPYEVDPDDGGGRNSVDYYHFAVETNAVAAAFLVYDATTNLTMVLSRGLPLPTDRNFDYREQTRTYGYAQIMVYTNSIPVELAPGDWYIGVYNGAYSATEPFDPISYKIVATQYTNEIPTPSSLFSGRPVSGQIPPGETHYYQYRVSTNGVLLWTELDQIVGNGSLNLYNKYGLPLPDSGNRFYEFTADSELGLDWWLTLDTAPYPLISGTWYYAIENTNSVTMDYRLRVTELSADPASIIWLENGVAQTNIVGLIPDGTNHVYYGFDVTTNAVGSLFEVFDRQNGDVSLYSMAGSLPNPRQYLYWYLASEGATNAFTRLNAWSGALTPGYWFFTAVNSETAEDPASATNVTYQIRASEIPTPGEDSIVRLINEYPVRVNNAPLYSESYFHYATSPRPMELTFTVTNVSDMVSVYLLDKSPTNGPSLALYSQNWVGPFGAQITLDLTNSFIPLVEGDWYVVVENTSLGTVGYDIWAAETGLPEPEQPINTGFEYDPETGLYTLVWESEIGAVYGVMGTKNAFATPVRWEEIDRVTAVETVTRYLLTRELMEQYVFFSVMLISKPTTDPDYEPENISICFRFDSGASMLELGWNARINGVYDLEVKETLADTNWTRLTSLTNTSSAMLTHAVAVPDQYATARVTPRGGVTPLTIHTSSGYDSGSGEYLLSWDARAGLAYSVRGWTNLGDRVSLLITNVVPETTEAGYRLNPAQAPGCQWFSVDYAETLEEEIVMAVGIDKDNKEVVLSWNAVIGNQYRIEGSKNFSGTGWETLATVQADSERGEYRVSMASGYLLFRIVALGGGYVPPENKPFFPSIRPDAATPGNIFITVQAQAGDRFTVEYTDDLSEDIWSLSAGEYLVDEDGPYSISLSSDGQKTKFFRLKRTR